jgi:hypothetical protein
MIPESSNQKEQAPAISRQGEANPSPRWLATMKVILGMKLPREMEGKQPWRCGVISGLYPEIFETQPWRR